MKSKYLSIKKDIVTETIIEKSRFICTAKRVCNDDEAKLFVQEVKKRYPDATHNCYAYVADYDGFYSRYSDDGEPSGTAGMPMLDALKNREIFCTAVVVTRYFGGVKLGTGGLVRAYQGCVLKTIDEAGVVENILSKTLKTTVTYNNYPLLLKLLDNVKSIVNSTDFIDNGVELTFTVPCEIEASVKEKICDFSAGKSTVLELLTGYAEYKI